MKIVFTKHTREMLNLRGIDAKMIRACIKKPDIVLPAKEGRRAYLKLFGENYLKVIVANKDNYLFVVTCYWLDKRRVKR